MPSLPMEERYSQSDEENCNRRITHKNMTSNVRCNKEKDIPRLKYNRSFGGFDHVYDTISEMHPNHTGISMISKKHLQGMMAMNNYQCNIQTGFTAEHMNENKNFIIKSPKIERSRQRLKAMNLRINPITENEKPVENINMEHNIMTEYNRKNEYSENNMSLNKEYRQQRKSSVAGYSDPGVQSPLKHAKSFVRQTSFDETTRMEKRKTGVKNYSPVSNLTNEKQHVSCCKSLDSSEVMIKELSTENNKPDQTQSFDSSLKRTRFLTRQKTFRMDSVEMIEALLGATTFRNNNNLTLPSSEKRPSVKRNSDPDNVRPALTRQKRYSQPSTATTNKLQDYRLVVLGSGGVGKSSLVTQFLNGFFPCQYKPTVEDSYRHLVQLPDGVFHTIEILDTAGLHQFPAMRRLSILSGDAFIVVFSVDNKESFTEALQLIQLIFETKGINPTIERVPIILVGNKCDLEDTRQVTHEEAVASALEKNLCAYIQTSAKDNENVQQLFSELLIQTFGVHEKLEEISAKKSSSFKQLKKQLSDKVLGKGKRHHSDGDATLYGGDQTAVQRKQSIYHGCTFSEPACNIL